MEIRKIAHGQKISQPGIYEMPINWYHDDCCEGPSVSSTGLRTIALETPLHYWDTSYLNPDRDPDATDELEGDHFRMGRAAHWRMLEPELFKTQIAVRPEIWDSWRTKDSKEWMRTTQREGLTILTPAEMVRVEGIAKALKAHPLHDQGLLGGAIEASLIVRDKKTGIWLKSRPDAMPVEGIITDLKILSDCSPRGVERSVNALGYDMQMSLTMVCWEALTEHTLDQQWIVACEPKRPHAIHIAPMSTTAVYWARVRIRAALDTMHKCLTTGEWPAWGMDGKEVGPSDRDVKMYEEMQKGGLLPTDVEF